jgi:hemoglobin/transferrin/lactoferrin receptor protein
MALPLVALLAPAAQAQTSDAQTIDAPTATDSGTPFSEIVVTGTRTERELFTTPVAIDAVSLERIQALQPYGFEDLLREVPNVEINGGPRRIAEEPTIRGFSDEQVVIRLDGARQTFDLAHRGRFFSDPDLIRRIEVVRGSSSALYGSGALGGVIALETAGARDFLREGQTLGARLRGGFNTNGNEWLVSGGVFGTAGPFDLFANVLRRKVEDDLTDGAGRPIIDSADRVTQALGKIGWQPDDRQRFQLIVDHYENVGFNPTNANAVSEPTTVVDRDTRTTSVRANYRYGTADSRFLNLRAAAWLVDIDVAERRIVDTRADLSDFKSRGVDIANTVRVLESDLVSLRLTGGFEWFRDTQSGTRNGVDRPQFPRASRTFVALFAQAELDVAERFSLIPALRWDKASLDSNGFRPDRSDDKVTPRISAGFKVAEPLFVWASYADSFRTPSLTELYSDGVHFTVPLPPTSRGVPQLVINRFVPTPDLLPEEAKTWEIGARARAADLLASGDTLEASVVGFSSRIDNLIEQTVVFISGAPVFTPPRGPLTFPGQTVNRNVDGRIKGLELTLRYDSPRINLSLAGHLLDGSNRTTDTPLAFLPQDRLTLNAEWKWFEQNARLGARVTFTGDRTDDPDPANHTAGATIVDLTASWRPLDRVTLSLTAANLFDRLYRIHPNAVNQPGRAIRFGATWQQ